MKRLDEIREREAKASAEIGRLTAGNPGDFWRWSIPADEETDSDLILSAPLADIAALTSAIRSVLDLHKVRVEQVITGDCSNELCEHEEDTDCPKTPFEVCAQCWDIAEQADAYFMEGGVSIVAYPCPTVAAIITALGTP